jgi:ribosomal protein L15E
MARAEAWAREASAGYVVVRSNVRRTESHAFYPSIGYAPSKTQAVYRKSLGA